VDNEESSSCGGGLLLLLLLVLRQNKGCRYFVLFCFVVGAEIGARTQGPGMNKSWLTELRTRLSKSVLIKMPAIHSQPRFNRVIDALCLFVLYCTVLYCNNWALLATSINQSTLSCFFLLSWTRTTTTVSSNFDIIIRSSLLKEEEHCGRLLLFPLGGTETISLQVASGITITTSLSRSYHSLLSSSSSSQLSESSSPFFFF